jgi:chromosome segregation ATPase
MNFRFIQHHSSLELAGNTTLPILLVELEEIEEQLEALQQARTKLLDQIAQANQRVTRAEQLLKTPCNACI